jgi:hypothetical protein
MDFKITKDSLDKRICDVEAVMNTQTYREFIRESENEFEMEPRDLDKMSDTDLNSYFYFLDDLWLK